MDTVMMNEDFSLRRDGRDAVYEAGHRKRDE